MEAEGQILAEIRGWYNKGRLAFPRKGMEQAKQAGGGDSKTQI